MKKILLINGSPKINSLSKKMTMSLLEGINKNNEYEITEVVCRDENIKPCKGCLCCTFLESGKCCIDDSMQKWITKYKEADILIWSFPIFFYGMPATAKKFLDRLISVHNPYTKNNNRKIVFIVCTCGFHSIKNNTEALLKEFELIYGEQLIPLFIPEAILYSNSFLNYKTEKKYISLKNIGSYFSENQMVPKDLIDEICTPVFSEKEFNEFFHASFYQKKENITKQQSDLLDIR